MKKLFTVAALMLGFAIASNAQQPPASTKETKKEEKKKMKDELNLSKDQDAKLKDVNKEYKTIPRMTARPPSFIKITSQALREAPSISSSSKKSPLYDIGYRTF